MSHVRFYRDVVSEQLSGLAKFNQTVCVSRLLLIGQTQIPMRQPVVRIHLESFLELLYCRVVLVSIQVMPSQVHVQNKTKRIQIERAFTLSQRFFDSTHRHQIMRIPVMSIVIVWIKFDRPLEFFFSAWPVPIVIQFDEGERSMRLSESIIRLQSLQRCGLRLGYSF